MTDDDRNIACLIIFPTLAGSKDDLSLASIKEKMEDSSGAYDIKAYHKVYKLGVTLPVI